MLQSEFALKTLCRKQPQVKAQVLYELHAVLIALGEGTFIWKTAMCISQETDFQIHF